MNHHPKFIDVSIGASVRSGKSLFVVEARTTAETILGRNVATGEHETLHVAQIAAAHQEAGEGSAHPDLVANAPHYAAAQHRLDVILPLIRNPSRTRADVEAAAAAAKCSPATIYNWMRAFEDSPQISSLIPDKSGPDTGAKRLDPRIEAIVAQAIEKVLKTPQQRRVRKAIEAVNDMCRVAGLTPPHANSVRARVRSIPRREMLRSQGRGDEARDTLEPATGRFPDAHQRLAVLQMDHGEADVLLVDDRLRLPLGRPWITVVIDVYTRMIVGLVVSMEHPSSFAAGRCIANAMNTKDAYLRSLNVPGEWPAWGKPDVVHMDNAKEFRGELLRTAFEEYGIELRLRKVKTPHYGGHIERLMRTFAEAIRDLPGATFSSPEERKGYDSEARAVMTLGEFEAWLVDYVVNEYHRKPHHGLNGLSPLAKWQESVVGTDDAPGTAIPSPPADPERLKLDFLPFERRIIGRQGIRSDYIDYWHDSFRRRIGEADPEHRLRKRKFLIRIDPRDVTRVWFLDPDTNAYTVVPTLDISRPAVSRWEWKAVQRALRAEGKEKTDEESLFRTRARLQARAEEATTRTKAARRTVQRADNAARHAAKTLAAAPPVDRRAAAAPGAMAPETAPSPDPSDDEITPFDDIDASP